MQIDLNTLEVDLLLRLLNCSARSYSDILHSDPHPRIHNFIEGELHAMEILVLKLNTVKKESGLCL